MPQFVDHSLSSPVACGVLLPAGGPVCCVSTRNTCPIHISDQSPTCVITMGMFQAVGCTLVPSDWCMRRLLESDICIMWGIDMSIPLMS